MSEDVTVHLAGVKARVQLLFFFFLTPLVVTGIPGGDPCPWTLKLSMNSIERTCEVSQRSHACRPRASSVIFLIFLLSATFEAVFGSHRKLFYVQKQNMKTRKM